MAHTARLQCEFLFLHLPSTFCLFASSDLSPDELASLQGLNDLPATDDNDWVMANNTIMDVLSGTQLLNISHEGGEFEAITELYKNIGPTYVQCFLDE